MRHTRYTTLSFLVTLAVLGTDARGVPGGLRVDGLQQAEDAGPEAAGGAGAVGHGLRCG